MSYISNGNTGGGGASTWQDPVTNVGDLPAAGNVLGDARVVTDDDAIYIWDGSDWQLVSGGSSDFLDPVDDVSELPDPAEGGQLIVVKDADGSGNPAIFVYDANIPNWVQQSGVTSVFTRTGDVVAEAGDYTAAQVGAVATIGNESINGIKTFVLHPVIPNDPTLDGQAVNKKYVDDVAQNLSWKTACIVASNSDIDLSNPGTDTFDGVTLTNGQRILVKNQTDPTENGIYIFNGSSSAMTRSTDADTPTALQAAAVNIAQGTEADRVFRQQTDNPDIGTDPIIWVDIFSVNALTGNGGIDVTGNVISAKVDDDTIEINNNDDIALKDGGITNAKIGETIEETKGGTGQATYTTGDILYADSSNSLTKLPVGNQSQILAIDNNAPVWVSPPSGGATTTTYSKNFITDTSVLDVTDATGWNDIFSYTFAPNEFPQGRVLSGIISGVYLNNSGASRRITFRTQHNSGANTLTLNSPNIPNSSQSGNWSLQWIISNDSGAIINITMILYGRSGTNSTYTSRIVRRLSVNADSTTWTLTFAMALLTSTSTQTLSKRFISLNYENITETLGGGMEIGEDVLSADPNRVLFADGDGDLNQSENLIFDNDGINGLPQFEAKTFSHAFFSDDLDVGGNPEEFFAFFDGGTFTNNGVTIPTDGTSTFQQLIDTWNTANPSNTITVIDGGALIPDNGQDIEFDSGSEGTIGNVDIGQGLPLTGTVTNLTNTTQIVSGYLAFAGGYIAGAVDFDQGLFNIFQASEQGIFAQATQGQISFTGDDGVYLNDGDTGIISISNGVFSFNSDNTNFIWPNGAVNGKILAYDSGDLAWIDPATVPSVDQYQILIGEEADTGNLVASGSDFIQANYNTVTFEAGGLNGLFPNIDRIRVSGSEGVAEVASNTNTVLRNKETTASVDESNGYINRRFDVSGRTTDGYDWTPVFSGVGLDDLTINSAAYAGSYNSETITFSITAVNYGGYLRVSGLSGAFDIGDNIEVQDFSTSVVLSGDIVEVLSVAGDTGSDYIVLENIIVSGTVDFGYPVINNTQTGNGTAFDYYGVADAVDITSSEDGVISEKQPALNNLFYGGSYPVAIFGAQIGHTLADEWDVVFTSLGQQPIIRASLADGRLILGDILGNRDGAKIDFDSKTLHIDVSESGSVNIGNQAHAHININSISETIQVTTDNTLRFRINNIGIIHAPLPSYDDDAAAGAGGLVADDIYQTTGSGSAPLNAAGIVMIKQ